MLGTVIFVKLAVRFKLSKYDLDKVAPGNVVVWSRWKRLGIKLDFMDLNKLFEMKRESPPSVFSVSILS